MNIFKEQELLDSVKQLEENVGVTLVCYLVYLITAISIAYAVKNRLDLWIAGVDFVCALVFFTCHMYFKYQLDMTKAELAYETSTEGVNGSLS